MRRNDDGMTMIEVMVATMILLVGVVGSFGAFDGIRRLGTISEKKQEASRYAQREIEHLRSLGWASLQLSSTPAPMSDSRGTVTNGTYAPPGGTASPLRIAASCPTSASCVDPAPTAWTAGNANGYVYRYITTETDSACGAPCATPGGQLRITVAVTVSSPHNPINALVLSTVVIDPSARPPGSAAPTNPVETTAGASIGAATGTTYYLTDTAVGATYAAAASNHAARDTVTSSGVPDQLRTATPDPGTSESAYQYSTDVYQGPDGGLGVAGSASCAGTTRQTAHRWVTPVLNSSAAVTATGAAALSIPTATWNATATAATICLKIYSVAVSGANLVTSSTLLGSFSYALPLWPTGTETLAFPFRYMAEGTTASVAAGRRLALTITADLAASPGISLVYDHPNYQASVQLETQ